MCVCVCVVCVWGVNSYYGLIAYIDCGPTGSYISPLPLLYLQVSAWPLLLRRRGNWDVRDPKETGVVCPLPPGWSANSLEARLLPLFHPSGLQMTSCP